VNACMHLSLPGHVLGRILTPRPSRHDMRGCAVGLLCGLCNHEVIGIRAKQSELYYAQDDDVGNLQDN
jgi:hypothetical protein